MEVELTPGQLNFVRNAIKSGRLHAEEDMVREALCLWEERERRRVEILEAVKIAEASLSCGEGRTIQTAEELRQLANDVKRRGLARFSAEHGR